MSQLQMKKIPALVFFLAALVSLFADDVFSRPLDAQTRPRYLALSAGLGSRPYVKGNFEQTKTIARLNRSLVSRGNFIIAAETGMVWDTRSPFPSTMAVGRDFIIQSSPGGGRSKIDARGNETFAGLASVISAVFTGNAENLDRSFQVFFAEDGKNWTLGLIPLDRAVSAFAERIRLEGEWDSAAGGPAAFIRVITLFERSGGSVRYVLSNHTFPPDLTGDEKALFSLD
jgi:hypothetical protein